MVVVVAGSGWCQIHCSCYMIVVILKSFDLFPSPPFVWPYQVDDENDDDDDNTENAPSGKKKLNSGQTFVHLVHRHSSTRG